MAGPVQSSYRRPSVPPVTVTLVIPSPLLRWVVPLGLVCLVPLGLTAVLLPEDVRGPVFSVLRVVFVVGYLVLLGLAMKSRRRPAQVHVDAEGLREGQEILVPRASIGRVLFKREGALHTIQLRGRITRLLETTSGEDARALLAALDPEREASTLTVLAATTSPLLVSAVWMGVPIVVSLPLNYALMRQVPPVVLVLLGAPWVAVWIFATWWFARRRRLDVATTHLTLPRLLSTRDAMIPHANVVHARVVDAHTVEVAFRDRGPKRVRIYDPAELAEYVETVNRRAGVSSRS